jgi:hypothetical protein
MTGIKLAWKIARLIRNDDNNLEAVVDSVNPYLVFVTDEEGRVFRCEITRAFPVGE